MVWVLLADPLLIGTRLGLLAGVDSFQLSFTRLERVGVAEPVGLKNYQTSSTDPIFRTRNSEQRMWIIGFGGLSVIIGLALAVALRDPPRRRHLPQRDLSTDGLLTGRHGLFWRVLYRPDGPINTILRQRSGSNGATPVAADPNTASGRILVAAIWRQAGYIMVSISPDSKASTPASRRRRPSTGQPGGSGSALSSSPSSGT